jgi:hypothetical protein
VILCGSVRAAAPPQSLAPFLDDEATAVVRLDLTKLDVPKTAGRLLGPIAVEGQQIAPEVLTIQKWTEAIRKAGGTELFLIFGLSNFQNLPSVVVPLPAGADAKQIGEVLCGGSPVKFRHAWPTCAVVHDAVFAGTPEALERVRRNDPKTPLRPGLAEALGAESRGELQVALAPTADQRRILEEMIPNLPKEVGGGPIAVLSQGMTWAVAGVELEPRSALHLSIQGRDAGSAQALKTLLTAILKLLGTTYGQIPGVAESLGRIDLKVAGDRLTSDLDVDKVAAVMRVPLIASRAAATKSQCVNNLKQIMLAMHNYLDADESKAFPPAFKADKAGKPLLSWRVLILPYLDEGSFYKEFHLDEAWDSPHNKALIAKMPAVYRCPSQSVTNTQQHKTTYIVPRGKSMAFPGAVGRKIKEFTDGTSNTIMVVDAGDDRAVIWTAPDDWEVEGDLKPETVLNHHQTGSPTGLADGSVKFLKANIKPEVLRLLLTPAGGEVVNYDDL